MNKKRILFNYLLFWIKKKYSNLLTNVNKRNELLECIGDNDIERFNGLINRFNIHFQDKEKNNLLHYACLAGRLGFIQKLISLGINTNHKNIRNETPLITKFIIKPPNYHEILDILISKKTNLYIRDCQNKDALNYACESGDKFILSCFFKQGLPSERVNYNTFINAMKGCSLQNLSHTLKIEVLEMFLKQGFNINFMNSEKHGLLHYFAVSYDQQMFHYAIDNGCHVLVKDNKGKDILDFVLNHNFGASKDFCTILAKHFLGTDTFQSVLERIEQNYSSYNSYYKKEFVNDLKEMEIFHRKDTYELSLPVKENKKTKRIKI
jgi:ankyrin repeat protein